MAHLHALGFTLPVSSAPLAPGSAHVHPPVPARIQPALCAALACSRLPQQRHHRRRIGQQRVREAAGLGICSLYGLNLGAQLLRDERRGAGQL